MSIWRVGMERMKNDSDLDYIVEKKKTRGPRVDSLAARKSTDQIHREHPFLDSEASE